MRTVRCARLWARGHEPARVCLRSVHCAQLKTNIRSAPLLADALTSTNERPPTNELLAAVVENLRSPELVEIESRILAVIDDEAVFTKKTSIRMLECLFAVRPKVCSFLDVTRQTLHDSIRDMEGLVANYTFAPRTYSAHHAPPQPLPKIAETLTHLTVTFAGRSGR